MFEIYRFGKQLAYNKAYFTSALKLSKDHKNNIWIGKCKITSLEKNQNNPWFDLHFYHYSSRQDSL